MAEVVVMVTTSYPRFPGDSVGTFMEPIARTMAGRGHQVHVVAPWHPAITRPAVEDGVRFHFFRYAPVAALNVFGYAAALRADVSLRAAALAATPLALTAGWLAARRVARRYRATLMHGHWVVPGGAMAAAAAPSLPLVISLHGSDVYVAETVAAARRAARMVFRRADAVTACSSDLARRGITLGADIRRIEVLPYGVDAARFRPDPAARRERRGLFGLADDVPLVFAAGRLVRKKGFEYLIDALPLVAAHPAPALALAGDGDLGPELRERARAAGARVHFLGTQHQDAVGAWLAAADVVVLPSVRDDAGNVDGLPNIVLEALASGTPLVSTHAGGIGSAVEHERTGLLVPERDPAAIAAAVTRLLDDRSLRERLGAAARGAAASRFGWATFGERLDAVYRRALAHRSARR
jgi:phosphatidyl-myo-inositol dimannoside synthase